MEAASHFAVVSLEDGAPTPILVWPGQRLPVRLQATRPLDTNT